MAASAGRVCAVLLQPLAHCECIQYRIVLKDRYVGWRRRRRRTDQVLQYPMAAKHRRRARGIGSHRKYACLSKQPSAAATPIERHSAEMAAVNMRNSVVFCQALIEVTVVRLD